MLISFINTNCNCIKLTIYEIIFKNINLGNFIQKYKYFKYYEKKKIWNCMRKTLSTSLKIFYCNAINQKNVFKISFKKIICNFINKKVIWDIIKSFDLNAINNFKFEIL